MKVAIASSDGKYVNQDIGHTGEFFVFDVQRKEYLFLEKRELRTGDSLQGTTEDRWHESMDLLNDCKALIVSKIPPAVYAVLRGKGITPYIIPGFIEDALDELKYRKSFEKKIMRRV